MPKSILWAAAVAMVASGVAFCAGSADATTFAAWKVANVPSGDLLNVRKYPASGSQIQASYPNGTALNMTGRCTGNVPDLRDISEWPDWKQEQTVRYQWCEVWHDPVQNGDFATGWVYGKFISPY